MALESCETVCIPCEVKRSVVPDERVVTLDWPTGQWTGFADVRQPRDEIVEGRTAIRATIVEASGDQFSARLPGQTHRPQDLPAPAAQRHLLRQG